MSASRLSFHLALALAVATVMAACGQGSATNATSEPDEPPSAEIGAEEPQEHGERQPRDVNRSDEAQVEPGDDSSEVGDDASGPDRQEALRVATTIDVDLEGAGSLEEQNRAIDELRNLALDWSEHSDVTVDEESLRLYLPGDAQSVVGRAESVPGVEVWNVSELRFSAPWPRTQQAVVSDEPVEVTVELVIRDQSPTVSGSMEWSVSTGFADAVEVEILISRPQLVGIGKADACSPSAFATEHDCVVSAGTFQPEQGEGLVTVLDYSMPELSVPDLPADALYMLIQVQGQRVVLGRT